MKVKELNKKKELFSSWIRIHGLHLGAIHTKIDLSWIDLRSISVHFEKVFTLI